MRTDLINRGEKLPTTTLSLPWGAVIVTISATPSVAELSRATVQPHATLAVDLRYWNTCFRFPRVGRASGCRWHSCASCCLTISLDTALHPPTSLHVPAASGVASHPLLDVEAESACS